MIKILSNINPGLTSHTHTDCTHIYALTQIYVQPNAYWPVCYSPFRFKADQWSWSLILFEEYWLPKWLIGSFFLYDQAVIAYLFI